MDLFYHIEGLYHVGPWSHKRLLHLVLSLLFLTLVVRSSFSWNSYSRVFFNEAIEEVLVYSIISFILNTSRMCRVLQISGSNYVSLTDNKVCVSSRSLSTHISSWRCYIHKHCNRHHKRLAVYVSPCHPRIIWLPLFFTCSKTSLPVLCYHMINTSCSLQQTNLTLCTLHMSPTTYSFWSWGVAFIIICLCLYLMILYPNY